MKRLTTAAILAIAFAIGSMWPVVYAPGDHDHASLVRRLDAADDRWRALEDELGDLARSTEDRFAVSAAERDGHEHRLRAIYCGLQDAITKLGFRRASTLAWVWPGEIECVTR